MGKQSNQLLRQNIELMDNGVVLLMSTNPLCIMVDTLHELYLIMG